MAVGLLVLLGVLFGLVALVVPWVIALVDALRRPEGQWSRAHQSKPLWVLLIVLTGIIGALLYAVIARPALNQARVISERLTALGV